MELLLQARRFRRAGIELVVVSPSAIHPYSGMGPGVLGGDYRFEETQLPIGRLVQRCGATFIADRIDGLDQQRSEVTLCGGGTLRFDVLSLNLGSEVTNAPKLPSAVPVYRAKPIEELEAAGREIERRVAAGRRCVVVVIGGGPAGVELAANAASRMLRAGGGSPTQGSGVDLYSAAQQGLGGMIGRRARYVERVLGCRGVQLHMGQRVDPVRWTHGSEEPDAVLLLATGVRPPPLLASLGLPTGADGAVVVDRTLRVEGTRNIFAAGDCASFAAGTGSLDRVGVYAVRQQSVLLRNLLASAVGDDCIPFTHTGPYLFGLNLGLRSGIVFRGPWSLRGRPAFLLKDWIDRRFMERYRRVR